MTTVYIDEMGAKLHRRAEEIHVDKNGQTLARIPLAQIDRLVLAGPVQLSTQALALFLERGIPVAFTTTHGDYRGRLAPATHKHAALRLAQYECHHDQAFRLRQARAVVRGKIKNGEEAIQKHRRSHPETDVEEELSHIGALLSGLDRPGTIDSLMGHEGVAARHYFSAFGKMVRREFSFTERSRRPPRDPVNALLSLGYTLLFHEVVTAIEAIGLDPYIGFLHGVEYGRASLAVDLAEEFRCLIDALVLAMINRGELNQADFQKQDDGGWLLNDKPRKDFYRAYEKKVRAEVSWDGQTLSHRRIFFHQAEHLARVVLRKEEQYQPYQMR